MNERFETYNPAETEAFGEKMGREAKAGQVYCLSGDLGVGKTVFTKGFAKGLDITEHVTSPTFTIINEYEGRLPLYHFDVYRVYDEDELFELGYEEYFYGEGVCVVEWADLIEDLLPPETKLIRIEHGENPEERIYQCTF
jgi:tRNA threonylcarbamoyladenosine biosynthesis protein TsaE